MNKLFHLQVLLSILITNRTFYWKKYLSRIMTCMQYKINVCKRFYLNNSFIMKNKVLDQIKGRFQNNQLQLQQEGS